MKFWKNSEHRRKKHARKHPKKHCGPEEIEERRRQRENLVIFHLPESKIEDVTKSDEEDKTKMAEIFSSTLNVEDFKILKTYRLGKKAESSQETKPRPLLVKLRHVDEKYKILNNAKKVRTSEKPEIKSLWITKDCTKIERENQKKKYLQKKALSTKMTTDHQQNSEHVFTEKEKATS